MTRDMELMARALELAQRGRFSVSPNPMVGCVIAREGRILGEGFHERAGAPHAEIAALRTCTESVEGATLYVTLEPCCHTGRTPPCTAAIVREKIGHVIAATSDPNPLVAGKGFAELTAAGIKVDTGVLADEATRLNESFFHSILQRRPFVLLKAGMTLDGKLATIARKSRWITSEASREQSLALREEYDAILVGSGTIAADDPGLTRRLGWNRSSTPWLRVVVDAEGSVPASAKVVTDGEPTLLFTTSPDGYQERESLHVVPVRADAGRIDLGGVLDELDRRGIRSLIAEGGSKLHTDLIRRKLWQKMILFVAPIMVGGINAPSIFENDGIAELTDAERFRFDSVREIGPDLMITAYPVERNRA